MRPADIITAKRDGEELSGAVLTEWIHAYTRHEVADYQMAAWLMAVYLRGMSKAEISALTNAMVTSGEVLDLSAFGRLTADKHSTGGVGDKTSLIVGPLAAACGVKVAKMSGRGLSHTGGTIDKLESIRGFVTALSKAEFMRQLREVGLVIAGQTADLAPADKLLYALRDVTATVDAIPLIASSIMSKKLAAGAQNIVLDVKVGEGAFMKTTEQAVALAQAMVDIGTDLGRRVVAYVTGMDQPLGYAVGNALEIAEAVRTLKSQGPADLTEVCVTIAAEMVHLAFDMDRLAARRQVETALASGEALSVFRRFVQAQGGQWVDATDAPTLPDAALQLEVKAVQRGYIQSVHALAIGRTAMELGAGRAVKEDAVNPAVGVVLHVQTGDLCLPGDTLATVHAASHGDAERAVAGLTASFAFSAQPVVLQPLFFARVDRDGVHPLD